MRGERYALRAGQYLIVRASRRLPAGIKEERQREWLAELPVILHDRAAGSAPRRVARMLAFAADTLRGTILRRGAYRYQGAHAGGPAESIPEIVTGLSLVLGLLAFEGWVVYQLIFGANLEINFALTMAGLYYLIRVRARRSDSADESWFTMSMPAQGTGLFIRALGSQCGWGHPLLFEIISYCGYAISLGCLYMAFHLASSSLSRQHPVPPG